MSEKQYRDKIASLKKDEARLEADLRKARQAAAKHRADASSARSKITPRTSITMARSYERTAEAAEKRAQAEDSKITTLTTKLASVARSLSDAHSSLDRETRSAEARQQREESARASRLRQEDDRRRRQELEHARRVAQARRPVVQVMHVPVPPAEKLRILVMTANPVNISARSPDQVTLWTEREIRDAQRAIERAKHRDRLEFITRPAAQSEDLFEQLNLYTPRILHFSGHGSEIGIYFETDDRTAHQLLSGELLARVLRAFDSPPQVVVLNACDTQVTGELLASSAVEAVISMAQPISDTAARIFSEQFYSAIANGQSLASAVEQARVKLLVAGLEEEETPVLTCAADVDPAGLILVEP